jgi:hypothetical protein
MHAQFVIDQINPKTWYVRQMKYISKEEMLCFGTTTYLSVPQRSDYKDYITARTNLEGVQFIKTCFQQNC